MTSNGSAQTRINQRAGAALAAALGMLAAGTARAEPLVALLSGNALVGFDSASPGVVSGPVSITGLAAGESVRGIDYRPHDRRIYGLVSAADGTARIVTIDRVTGVATPVAALRDGAGGVIAPTATPIVLNGARFGVDFNPQVDLLRILSDGEQNLAANPGGRVAGGAAGTTRQDGALNIAGAPTPGLAISGAAYDRNVDGTPGTTLYTIDTESDLLAIQTPPNSGSQTGPRPLGVDAVGDAGFDISGATGIAYASFDVDLDDVIRAAPSLAAAAAGGTSLFTIDLGTGAATLVGRIGDALDVVDITVAPAVPVPATLALLAAGIAGFGALRRRACA